MYCKAKMVGKARAYIRVSDQQQVDDGSSLEVQENLARKFCEKEGLELVKVYKDEGKSGTKLKGRDGIMEMLNEIENGDIIIFYNNKRRARNIKDSNRLSDLIRKKGCKTYYTETGKYEKYVAPTEQIMNNMNNLIGEYESTQMGNTVSRIMLDMSERGTLIKKPAYGEMKLKDAKQGTPHVFNDKEWKGICRMFEMKEEDPSVSYARMGRILDEEGIKTKTGKGPWRGFIIKKIMEANKEKYEKYAKEQQEEKKRRIEGRSMNIKEERKDDIDIDKEIERLKALKLEKEKRNEPVG